MRPATGEWFDDLTGAATGPVSEIMRPVVGPRHPPPPGPARRCPGNGVCDLIGCRGSTRRGENSAPTSADQSAPDIELEREENNENVENFELKNGDAPAHPAVPAAAAADRQVKQYMQVG